MRAAAAALALVCCTAALPVAARMSRDHGTAAVTAPLTVAELPPAGRETYRLIRSGGPFAHDKDGTVFGNRERLLPPRARGYYREYTVETPRAGNRGARRIVCGGAVRMPDRCYYTGDHYATFREIVE